MISTAYFLPFQLSYCENVFSCGKPIHIRIRSVSTKDIGSLRRVVYAFSSLAEIGALSGTRIPPWETEFGLQEVLVKSENELNFFVERCYICDESLVVLAHMLFAVNKRVPVQEVEIFPPQRANLRVLKSIPDVQTSYPGLFSKLPFTVDNLDPESGGYTFFLNLEKPLELNNEARLNSVLRTWTRSILLGGYALAPLDPEESYVEPDTEKVTAYGTNVEWAVFKLRADPAAISAFINILAAFHVRCQRIKNLEIS